MSFEIVIPFFHIVRCLLDRLRGPPPFPKPKIFFFRFLFFFIYRCIKVPSRCAIKIRTIQSQKVSEKPGFVETYAKKKNFFFFLNIKLHYDVVYLYYKNQNHPRSTGKSLKNQGFWRHFRQKKFFFYIKLYYDVVYLYYKNQNHRRSIGL